MNSEKIKKYCDDCGFEFNSNDFNKRIDDKSFCEKCSPLNSFKLKKSNKDFCSLCGFKAFASGQGDLAKNKNSHYYHISCWNREESFGDIDKIEKSRRKEYIIFFLSIFFLMGVFVGLIWFLTGGSK